MPPIQCQDRPESTDRHLHERGLLKAHSFVISAWDKLNSSSASAKRLGEEVEQQDELRFFYGGGSAIVGDLDLGGLAVFPAEDDAPLLADTGAL